jgi:hypothetical protein
MNLPADLVAFLAASKQLEYDPAACIAGTLTLRPLADLFPHRFPVETSGSPLFEQDPHFPTENSYLVLGVNLVKSCTGDYESMGLLLWLPVEGRYGQWDSWHCTIQMFAAGGTWPQIAADPARYINALWRSGDPEAYPDTPPMEELVPWPTHPYFNQQVHYPLLPDAVRHRSS